MNRAVTYLTPVRPAMRGNGLAMRAGVFLEGLARDFEVHVAVVPVMASAPPDPGDPVARLAASMVTLELASEADALNGATVLLASPAGRERAELLYPLPSVCRRLSADGSERLAALVRESGLVHVMRSYLAPCLDFLLDAGRRPAVTLDLDELDSDVCRGLGDEPQALCFGRLERYYLPRFDRVYVASARDPKLILDRYGVPDVVCVPNAARSPSSAPSPASPASPSSKASQGRAAAAAPGHDLLFVGNLSYAPNVDAARWLCLEILPLLEGATVAIVGTNPGPAVRELRELEGVSVVADVPDISPWYASCRVAVVPLRTGGGTPTKVAEAGAHGRPVVATSFAVAGLAPGAGGFEIGDSAEGFAQACRRLLDDPELAAKRAASGRASHPSADQVVDRISALTSGLWEGEYRGG